MTMTNWRNVQLAPIGEVRVVTDGILVPTPPPEDIFPTITCLYGSTRFYDEFRSTNLRLTVDEQHIVLSIGCDFKSDDALGLTLTDKQLMDILHLFKIAMSHEVFIINVGDYMGESTRRELLFARKLEKRIRWLEPHTCSDEYCPCSVPL